MAIFSKKTKEQSLVKEDKEKKKASKPASTNLSAKASAQAGASKGKKEVKVKEKKATKPKSDAGAKLTKAPERILLAPRITEKAAYMTVNNSYVFEVAVDATKRDVVAAIKALYKVVPRKVNMVRKQPRAYIARFRNRRGTKSGMKKAYVFLKKGDKIDLG